MRRIPCRRSLLERDAKGDTSCVGYIILVTSSDYRNDLILFASIFCEGYDFLADGGFTGSSVRLNRVSGFADDLIADRSAGRCICFQNHLVSVCAGSGDRNRDFLALRQVFDIGRRNIYSCSYSLPGSFCLIFARMRRPLLSIAALSPLFVRWVTG